MKKIIILLTGITFLLIACKKPKEHQCPLITDMKTSHLVDLTPIKDVKELMDTLVKYPQLQAYKFHEDWTAFGHFIILHCNVFYNGLRIFTSNYSVYFSSQTGISSYGKFPKNIPIATEPSISRDKAVDIALNSIHFNYCAVSALGISNKGNDSIPDYKLVWRITGAESGYPVVEIDAQSGYVYYSSDGTIVD